MGWFSCLCICVLFSFLPDGYHRRDSADAISTVLIFLVETNKKMSLNSRLNVLIKNKYVRAAAAS